MVPAGNTFFVLALLIRTVEGAGIAALITASFAIIAHTFPSKAAAMIGTLELFTGLGLMAGPPVGGLLYKYGGFGTPFWSTGGLLLGTGLLTAFTLPSQRFEDESQNSSMLSLLRIPLVMLAAGFVTSSALCMSFINVSLALHLGDVYNFSPVIVGMIFLVGPGAYSLFAPLCGCLGDKLPGHTKGLLLLGFTVNTIGFILLGPAPFLNLPEDKLWLFLISLLCFGCGTATMVISFQIINQAAIENGFEESLKTFGLISGIFNTFFPLGSFAGPLLGGFMMDTIGFQWAAFVIAACSGFMCSLLTIYILVGKLCGGRISVKQGARVQQEMNEKSPLLNSV